MSKIVVGYKSFLESKRNSRIGELWFPDIYLDSFLTSMDDSGYKYTLSHGLVPDTYSEENLSIMISTSNGVNTLDFCYCFDIRLKGNVYPIDLKEELVNLKAHLSSDYDIYNTTKHIYIVSKKTIPLISWNKELQDEIKDKCIQNGLDMSKFLFPYRFPTFRSVGGVTEKEQQVIESILNDLSKKWVFRQEISNGHVLVDISLQIMNDDIK